MARKGYKAELKCKKELEELYGKDNVIKVAIGGAEDFLIAGCGELIKVVEVKEIHNKKKYYPTKREKEQLNRILMFAKQHGIPAELWLYQFWGKGKPVIKTMIEVYEVK